MGKIKPWYDWEMPPLWVCVVSGLILVGISTLVFWKIGGSIGAGTRATVKASPAAAPPRDPRDPDSF